MGVVDFASLAAVAASGLRLAESMILVPIVGHHQIQTAIVNGFWNVGDERPTHGLQAC
jgi:hypothetical protein